MVFSAPDGQIQGWLDVRLHLDAAFYRENRNPLYNGTELRRGRLGLHGSAGSWDAELDFDVGDNHLDVNDAYIMYSWSNSTLRIGQFKEPFSLERLTSSRYITFMERALPTQPGALPYGSGLRKMGVGVSRYGPRYHLSTGLFGQSIREDSASDDEGFSMSGRVVILPWRAEKAMLHIGGSGGFQTPESRETASGRARFRAAAETHVDRKRFLDTDNIAHVRYSASFGLESALTVAPLYLQGEYIETRTQRSGHRAPVLLKGGYVYASWMISGPGRAYIPATGEYVRIAPDRPTGAWELALRYSHLDFNDFDALILGGRPNRSRWDSTGMLTRMSVSC
jgi:phosphate-selective porin OprO/OprP